MIRNWIANKLCAILWPNIAFNIEKMVQKMFQDQHTEFSQRWSKFLDEQSDDRLVNHQLNVRQVVALEAIAKVSDAKH
jgi:hypothetical protein